MLAGFRCDTPLPNVPSRSSPLFTGLVKGLGRIQSTEQRAQGRTFRIASNGYVEGIEIGESIAVNGVCMTAETFGGPKERPDWFTCTAGHETLARTTLGKLRVGSDVHLEQALRLSDRLGGHLVTGHVDNLGTVKTRKSVGVGFDISIEAPRDFADLLVEKGSIAIDGVSLTIASVNEHIFSVMIIPHTSEKTLLQDYQPGRHVNLEGDIIGKYVKHMLGRSGPNAPSDKNLGDLLSAWSKDT